MAARRGEVIAYDQTRGMATVRLEPDGQEVGMHAVGYFSGMPNALPKVGDRILGQVKTIQGVDLIVFARPAGTPLSYTNFPGRVVPESYMNEAAFELLASSTATRYIQKARHISIAARLTQLDKKLLRERLHVLWTSLLQPGLDTRPPEEIEAALLIVALWGPYGEDTAPELKAIVDFKDTKSFPSTIWLKALVKGLRDGY